MDDYIISKTTGKKYYEVDIGIPLVQSSVDYSNLYNMAIERKNKKDE